METKQILLKVNPFLKVDPFLKVNPFNNRILFDLNYKKEDIYTQFKQHIKDKDKIYLQSVQRLLQARLKELL